MTINDKVAILGAGVMGSQIAAHFANVGISSLLFDLDQNLAENGLRTLEKIKPAALYSPRYMKMITPCNYQNDLEKLSEVGWIIEGIVEKLDVKKEFYAKIVPYLKEDTIISSNTSGLLHRDLCSGMPSEFQQRFLITHFFNPPRYMHLLEIIPGPHMIPEFLLYIQDLAENILGKGVVKAKDTPNFIANRIGIFGMMFTLKLTQDMHLKVEEIDKLTGPVIGHPRSASFRTADLVGLDTLAHVSQTSYEKVASDEKREIFEIPKVLRKMLQNNWLGAKTGSGFYLKEGQNILSLNLDTLEYTPQKRVRFDALRLAKKEWTLAGKIRAMAYSEDVAGKFCWELLSNLLIYAANRIPEISEDIVNIDNAMKWGYGWELGPFETWEALGLDKSLERMTAEGKIIPEWIINLYDSGHRSFYNRNKLPIHVYNVPGKKYKPIRENPKIIHLDILKNSGKCLKKNWNASLIDLGDGVALTEFHSIIQPQFNPLDGSSLDMISEALDMLTAQGYRALIIGHQGLHFSVGVNLALIIKYSEEKKWSKIEILSKTFQDITQKVRFSPLPVIAAPFNLCLGGGFELISVCSKRVASAELYCGLVETGIGLIPGAGGNLRLLLNLKKAMSPARPGSFPIVQKAFENIGFAKVSSSAKEAVFLGFLQKEDKIVLNPRHLIFHAKSEALKLAERYQPPTYEKELILPGEAGRLAIEMIIDSYVKNGSISAHDALIGKKLAYVLCGGEKAGPFHPVDEQYILDIERETFVRLCAEPLSQMRMEHMLKTGKPLRN